jgi:hypothetical protein
MEWRSTKNEIEIRLPITTPTGKVRVKRPHAERVSNPVACRSRPMAASDYLEWQISYDTDDLDDPSIVPEAVLKKPSGVRYGCELVRLMVEARKLGLLTGKVWSDLRSVLTARQAAGVGIEEREQIAVTRATQDAAFETEFGFQRFIHHTPDYLKRGNGYAVEIKIAPKQRAVGTQAMIYLHLPVAACNPTASGALVGRMADKGEKALFRITKDNVALITDTTLAFVLASKNHARDIDFIFDALHL